MTSPKQGDTVTHVVSKMLGITPAKLDWLLTELARVEKKTRSLREGRSERITAAFVSNEGHQEWLAIEGVDGKRAKVLGWLREAQCPLDIASVSWVAGFIREEYAAKKLGGSKGASASKFIRELGVAMQGGFGKATKRGQGKPVESVLGYLDVHEVIQMGLIHDALRSFGILVPEIHAILLDEINRDHIKRNTDRYFEIDPQLEPDTARRALSQGEKVKCIRVTLGKHNYVALEARHVRMVLDWWKSYKRFLRRDPSGFHLLSDLAALESPRTQKVKRSAEQPAWTD